MRATVALLLSLVSLNVFAAGRPIAPRPIVPAPYTLRMASSAFAAGRFLNVWIYDTRGAGAHIVGVFSDGDGRRTSPAWFPIVTSIRPQWLHLLGIGDSYVLFWRGEDAKVTHMAEIDAQGRVTRNIESVVETEFGSAIAWNGMHFITINPDIQHSEAVIFDRDGKVLHRELLESAYHVSVLPSGDGFLAFVAAWGGLFANRISLTTSHSHQWKLDDGSGTTSGSIPKNIRAIATPGGDVLAVWIKGRFDSAQDLKSVVFRGGGAPLASRVVLSSTDVIPLHLTAFDDGYRLLGTTTSAALAKLSLDRDGAPRGGFTPVAGAGSVFADGDRTTLALSTTTELTTSRVTTTAIPRDGDVRAEVVSLAPARQTDPVIIAAGGNFVAAWTESSADLTFIRTAFLAPWGETLSTATVLENAALDRRRLAWNGSELLLLARRGDRLLGMRLSRTGVPIDAEPFAIGDVDSLLPTKSSALWAGDRWVVAWSHLGRLFTAEVSSSGTASPAREINPDTQVPVGWSRTRTKPSLVLKDNEVVIVWNEQQEKVIITPIPVIIGNRDVRTLVFAAGLDDAEATVVARDSYHSAAASNGSELLVVTGGSDIVWDGAEYVVATRNGASLTVQRLDQNGVPTTARSTPIRLPGSSDILPSIAAERWSSAIVALHEFSAPGDTQQAVSVLESEMQPLVEPPPRRRSTRH